MTDFHDILLGAQLYAIEPTKKEQRKLRRACRSCRHSANLVVDIGGTCQITAVSIAGAAGGAGAGGATVFGSGSTICVGSNTTIGQTVDLLHADTFCNLFAMGQTASGQLRLQIQTSDSDVSGTFTDPTSGLAQLPTYFSSGGQLFINSGGTGQGILGAQTSGQSTASGFAVAAGFQRVGRFARVNIPSEATAQFAGPLVVGFISQYKTTGSGGGFSFAPGSGSINV